MLETISQFLSLNFVPIMANLGVVTLIGWLISVTIWPLAFGGRYTFRSQSILAGSAFGIAAVVLMHLPIEVRPGIFGDARAAPILVSGIVGGPFTAVAAGLVAGLGRFLIGGSGATIGLVYIAAFTVAGIAAQRWFLKDQAGRTAMIRIVILAAGVTISTSPLSFAFNDTVQMVLLFGLWPVMLVANVLGTAILWMMIEREKHGRDNAHMLWQSKQELEKQLRETEAAQSQLEQQALRLEEKVLSEANLKARSDNASKTLKTAIESIEDGFVLYDSEDRLVLCNAKYREIYKTSADLLVPGNTFEYIVRTGAERGQYPDAIGRVDDWVAERMANHLSGDTAIEQRLDDGRWLKIAERATPTGGIVGFRVDITELKRAQQAAEAADRAKSEFLASMSHEIRTPMTGVIGFADLLLKDQLASESRFKVEKIKAAAQSLLSIINNILDLSKLDAGKLELERLDFSVATIIADVVELVRQSQPEERLQKVRFSFKIEDEIPPRIRTDPTRLRQVLINLVGNAAKFTQEGSITVSCEKMPNLERLVIRVQDTGLGIEPGKIPTLFQDFTQADASISREYEGTGLGLAICKRLVELMGGSIDATSKPGDGSTFEFVIPYQQASGEATYTPPSPPSTEADATNHSFEKLSVLVAEDNEINQMIVKSLLDDLGIQSHCVENGLEAIKELQRADYDLILMDVRMPGMSGIDATRLIRALDGYKSNIPIIALTADVMTESVVTYSKIGMNNCLAKPIDPIALRNAIAAVAGPARLGEPEPAEVEVSVDEEWSLEAAANRFKVPVELYQGLALKFCDDYGDIDARITQALSDGDMGRSAELAHSLKGVSANMNLPVVSEIAAGLETKFRAGLKEGLSDELDRLASHLHTSIKDIREKAG